MIEAASAHSGGKWSKSTDDQRRHAHPRALHLPGPRNLRLHCSRHPDGILSVEALFLGTIDSAKIHPCEIVKRALLHNVTAFIAVHNYPSGSPELSVADRATTARIKQALTLV